MSVSYSQFQQEVALQVLKFRWYSTVANPTPPAAVNAELNAIATALASDTTTHDETIENPASAALRFGDVVNTDFTDLILYHVNKGKAGNLSNATMAQAIDGVTGALAKPGVVDVPFLYGVPPYGNGSVLTCTSGNWVGTPSGYTYQFRRDGVNFGSATGTATYTIVTATDSGHNIDCVVVATNGQGSTTAPASNGVRIP
jgi:hypothetical protein